MFQFDIEERSNGLKSHQALMLKWEDSGFPAKKCMVILNSWDMVTMPLLSNWPHHLIDTLNDIIMLHRNHDIIYYSADVRDDNWTEVFYISTSGQKAHHIFAKIYSATVPQSLPDARDLWDMGIMCNAKLFIPPCFSLVIMHFSIIHLFVFCDLHRYYTSVSMIYESSLNTDYTPFLKQLVCVYKKADQPQSLILHKLRCCNLDFCKIVFLMHHSVIL